MNSANFKSPYFIKIKINPLSSLVITDTQGDPNMVKTKEYINGSVVLGLFAKIFLKSRKPDEEFYRLFLQGGLLFTNGYISDGDGAETISYPIPISMEKDKHPEKEDSIKAYDFIYGDESENNAGITRLDEETASTKDTKKKPIAGFGYIKEKDNKNYIKTISVETAINFHNSINNGQADNTVFNYESIKKDQVFISFIIGDRDDLCCIADLLRDYISDKHFVYIGRSKSSQYGKALIKLEGPLSYKNPYLLSIRGNLAENVSANTEGKVVITFLSNTIVYNDFGYSTVDIDVLSKYIGVKILNQSTRKSYVENFVSAWKAKKPSENMFAGGSSFLLEKLPDNYEKFELYGLGERTAEGFGRVAFGLQATKNTDYEYQKYREHRLNNPELIPETTKNLVVYSIKSLINEEITVAAIEEAGVSDSITNSLIGRLIGFAAQAVSFQNNLEYLRNTAKGQLKYAGIKTEIFSNNNHVSLIKYFEDMEDNLKKFIMQIMEEKYKIDTYCVHKGLKYDELKSEILKDFQGFKRLFLFNFLTQLKRNNKKDQKANKQ